MKKNLGVSDICHWVFTKLLLMYLTRNGAKFDENGNATDWWTEGRLQHFQTLQGC